MLSSASPLRFEEPRSSFGAGRPRPWARRGLRPPRQTTSDSPVTISRGASLDTITDITQAAASVVAGPVRWSPSTACGRPSSPTAPGPRTRTRTRALGVVDVGALDDRLDATAAGVHNNPHAVALLGRHRREVDPAVGHRLLAGAHGEVDEAAHPARHLGLHHRGRVEVEHLGRDAHLELAGVERPDEPRARHRVLEVRPEVSKSLPIGMTAPRPMTTARRARSGEGTAHLSGDEGDAGLRRPDCSRARVSVRPSA